MVVQRFWETQEDPEELLRETLTLVLDDQHMNT